MVDKIIANFPWEEGRILNRSSNDIYTYMHNDSLIKLEWIDDELKGKIQIYIYVYYNEEIIDSSGLVVFYPLDYKNK